MNTLRLLAATTLISTFSTAAIAQLSGGGFGGGFGGGGSNTGSCGQTQVCDQLQQFYRNNNGTVETTVSPGENGCIATGFYDGQCQANGQCATSQTYVSYDPPLPVTQGTGFFYGGFQTEFGTCNPEARENYEQARRDAEQAQQDCEANNVDVRKCLQSASIDLDECGTPGYPSYGTFLNGQFTVLNGLGGTPVTDCSYLSVVLQNNQQCNPEYVPGGIEGYMASVGC